MKSHQNLNQINVIFKFIIFNKEINSIVAIKKDKKLEISQSVQAKEIMKWKYKQQNNKIKFRRNLNNFEFKDTKLAKKIRITWII